MKPNKGLIGKVTAGIIGLISLSYFGSCFYYLKPNQDAWVRRDITIENNYTRCKNRTVTSTGFHFKWTGLHEFKKYETKKDISLEDLLKDFIALQDYKESLKKDIKTKPITSEDQIWAEVKKIAEHFRELGITDEIVMPKKIRFKKLEEGLAGTAGADSINLNEDYQTDERRIKDFSVLHMLIHEFIHLQGMHDESYTECLAFELGASLAKENKAYEYSLLDRLSWILVYNMHFLIMRNKSLPHNSLGKSIEKLAASKSYVQDDYDSNENLNRTEDDFFEKSYDQVNKMLFYLRTKGKKELIEKVVQNKIPKQEYDLRKKMMNKRLETDEFDSIVLEYSGTTYQMIKDAITDDNTLKDIPWNHKQEILIDNLSRLLDKILYEDI